MESTFSVRPAVHEDLPKIVEIERQAHIAPWTEEHFRAELDKPYSHVLVMTDDETDSVVAGYIVFWVMSDDSHILNVAVADPYRGKGMATGMMRKVVSLAAAKGSKKVVLEVRKSNMPAIQLYQSLNFTIIHVRKGVYSNGEDAYEMALVLDDAAENIHF
ncbi:MAG: ribosomal protein S18-alanine N-acetyltransferase [Oligoflexia bacterium]|nr:ribosomal protein S18-alanine N-acetyltransferase [Oligoflexia bacterium]